MPVTSRKLLLGNISGAGKKGPSFCSCNNTIPTTTTVPIPSVIGTYSQANSSLNNYDIVYNAFTDTWMVAGDRRTAGIIFKTSGPITSATIWSLSLNRAISVILALTCIPNTSTWLACGTEATVVRSTDNGLNWTTENNAIIGIGTFNSIATNTTGTKAIAVGFNNNLAKSILYVNTGGTTWSQSANMPPNLVALNKVIYLPSVDRWLMVGASVGIEPAIFRSDTNDPAGTWTVIPSGGAYAARPLRDVKVTNNMSGPNKILFAGNFDNTSSFYTAEFTDVASLATLTLRPFATTIFRPVQGISSFAYALCPFANGGFVAGGDTNSGTCLYLNRNGDGTTWVPVSFSGNLTFTVRNIFAGRYNWMAVGDDSAGGRQDCVYIGTYT